MFRRLKRLWRFAHKGCPQEIREFPNYQDISALQEECHSLRWALKSLTYEVNVLRALIVLPEHRFVSGKHGDPHSSNEQLDKEKELKSAGFVPEWFYDGLHQTLWVKKGKEKPSKKKG